MTDPQNPYAPPNAEVRDAIETKKLGPAGTAALVALAISWLWLLLFSPAVWELTKTGATSVLFMFGAYLGLALIPIGAILLMRKSAKAHTLLGVATAFLLLAAAKGPFLPVVASGACAGLVTYFAFRLSRRSHRSLSEA